MATLPSNTAARLAALERELRSEDARWRAIVDNPFMGITVVDKNQYFVVTNPVFQAMTGYSNDELRKLTPLDITPAAQREENRKVFAELQRGERTHYELVKQLVRKDGKPIWIQLYVFAVTDDETGDRHTFGMNFDITEKMQAQEALHAAQAELARSAAASRMGAMAASIAHEINQPLTAIVANASAGLRFVMRKPADLGETRDVLEKIMQDGQRAGDVVHSIRAMFRPQETSRGLVDVNQLVSEVLVLMRGELESRTIFVKTELDERVTPVTANRGQVRQVFFNLVTNAAEAMDAVTDRSRTMLISSARGENGAIDVAVEDSGPGIDPDRIEQIFNSFYTTKAEGLGMGLAICRSIIEAHGGRLWASPRHPHGAIFRFTLPA